MNPRNPIALLALLLPAAAAAADYAVEVRSDRPVAWWRFADPPSGGGGEAKDAMGATPGICSGDVVLEDGPFPGSRAARFDGTSRIEVPRGPALDLDALTVELWMRTGAPADRAYWPGSGTLISRATAGAGSGDWTIVVGSRRDGRDQGRILAGCGPAGSGRDLVLISKGRRNDTVWHHIAWTRTADGAAALFIDGRQEDAGCDGGGSIRNGSPLRIGGETLEGGRGFAGSIAEVAIYAGALDPARIEAHFRAARPEALAAGPGPAAIPERPIESIALDGAGGLRWTLERRAAGWSLGSASLGGKAVGEPVPAAILFRNEDTDEEVRLAATEAVRPGPRSARLSGSGEVGGAAVRFDLAVTLHERRPAASIAWRFTVGKPLDGWAAEFPFHEGEAGWHLTLYPFAGNATALERDRLTFIGIPAALLFRPDRSLAALFGIDPASDYLNPTTWTGGTGFRFRQGEISPRFRVGGLRPGIPYELPLQVLLDGSGDPARAVTDLARSWTNLNGYRVEPLRVRTPDEALALFLEGRRKTAMWHPGKGYQIMDIWRVIYTAESPINAWFDYLVHEATGDPMWRERAFAACDFLLGAQHADPKDPHFGAIDTNFELDSGAFNSADHSPNLRFKVDMNSHAARYLLQLWRRVKDREGVDRKEWYLAAVRIADWVMRQRNADGGLPQVVADDPTVKSISVVSGRSLVAFPIIAEITGDARYGRFAEGLEGFLRDGCEDRFWFTGSHVDLWPKDFESDSVWHAVEYWLGKHARTGDPECLRRAEADAWFGFLQWCPKQLSWVKNPTQTCHAEQENYLQYSNYCYNNRKYWCLDGLARKTGQPLFGDLRDRTIQCGFWAQVTSGEWIGGTHERLSDPWGGVSKEVDSLGAVYLTELALDAALQLLEMGLADPGRRNPNR